MTSAAVEHVATPTKANIAAMAKSEDAAVAGFHELAEAYQALATKNAEKLTASIQALAAVKTPVEFIEVQQKLIKEGVASAVSDSTKIGNLTAAVFTAAFAPVKKQFEALQSTATKN
jgi:hypothetical protein